MGIGIKLTEFRKKKLKLTQEQLGKKLGISAKHLSKIENGRDNARPTGIVIEKLIKLGADPGWLFGDKSGDEIWADLTKDLDHKTKTLTIEGFPLVNKLVEIAIKLSDQDILLLIDTALRFAGQSAEAARKDEKRDIG